MIGPQWITSFRMRAHGIQTPPNLPRARTAYPKPFPIQKRVVAGWILSVNYVGPTATPSKDTAAGGVLTTTGLRIITGRDSCGRLSSLRGSCGTRPPSHVQESFARALHTCGLTEAKEGIFNNLLSAVSFASISPKEINKEVKWKL